MKSRSKCYDGMLLYLCNANNLLYLCNANNRKTIYHPNITVHSVVHLVARSFTNSIYCRGAHEVALVELPASRDVVQ